MTQTEQALDELASLVAGGGLGGGSKPTKSVLFRGVHTAGTLDSFIVDQDCALVAMILNESAYVTVTNGRLVSSFGAGFHPGGSAIAFCTGNTNWVGRQTYKAGDVLYFDSLANTTSNFFMLLMFEV